MIIEQERCHCKNVNIMEITRRSRILARWMEKLSAKHVHRNGIKCGSTWESFCSSRKLNRQKNKIKKKKNNTHSKREQMPHRKKTVPFCRGDLLLLLLLLLNVIHVIECKFARWIYGIKLWNFFALLFICLRYKLNSIVRHYTHKRSVSTDESQM